MDEKFVFYLIIFFAVLVFIALIALSLGAYRFGNGTGINPGGATSVITLSATGTASSRPTQAQVSITINGTGATTASAVQNISTTLNMFNSTVYKFLNGNMSLIETTYYSVYKPYQYCPIYSTNATSSGGIAYPVPVPKCVSNNPGYTAAEDLSLTLPNINNASSFLGAIAAIPNIYVGSVSPSLSSNQTASLRASALALAISNATSQADALLGPNEVIYSRNISVNSYYIYPYGVAESSGSGALASVAGRNATISPQFYSGTSQVTDTVSVVFHYGSR